MNVGAWPIVLKITNVHLRSFIKVEKMNLVF